MNPDRIWVHSSCNIGYSRTEAEERRRRKSCELRDLPTIPHHGPCGGEFRPGGFRSAAVGRQALAFRINNVYAN